MIQINLLPWRELERQRQKNRFFITLGICIGVTIFLVVLLHIYYAFLVGAQQRTNNLLQTHIQQQQKILADLNKQKIEQVKLKNQIEFIFQLRNKSYQAVRLLDELARITPEDVVLKSIVRDNNVITLTGKALSNFQVTLFMGNMTASHYFKQPVLTGISGKENSGGERIFQLKVELREPAT